jgi:hypothetical protein
MAKPADGPRGGAGAESEAAATEIEVTPEMFAAGAIEMPYYLHGEASPETLRTRCSRR